MIATNFTGPVYPVYSQNLRYKGLVIADYINVKMSCLTVLHIMLWLKEDGNLYSDHFW